MVDVGWINIFILIKSMPEVLEEVNMDLLFSIEVNIIGMAKNT